MDQKTIDTYNQIAKEYDVETVDFWEQFPRTVFDKFIELTKGKVLDLGSGPGRDGLILQKHGLDVVCLDASEAMVDLSREQGLETVLGDFVHLPFADQAFAGVWAYTSLLHVPKNEIDSVFDEISRVLVPGGILGLGLIEGDTEGYRDSAGIDKSRWFSFYQKTEVEELLAKHGFSLLHFEVFKPRHKNYLNFVAKRITETI